MTAASSSNNSRLYAQLCTIFVACIVACHQARADDESDTCTNARQYCREGSSLCEKYREQFDKDGSYCAGVSSPPHAKQPEGCSYAQQYCRDGSSLCEKYRTQYRSQGTYCAGVSDDAQEPAADPAAAVAGPDQQLCAQYLEGIQRNCPVAAGGGPAAIYCGTSRQMFAATGCDPALLDGGNGPPSGGVTVNIKNGGQLTTYGSPPISSNNAVVTAQGAGSNTPRFEPGFRQCVSVVRDGNGYAFANSCNTTVTVEYFEGNEAPSEVDVGAGQRQHLLSWLPERNVDYAVCRKSLGFFAADGQHVWLTPNTPYTCRVMPWTTPQ
jgi:hypothetical protein